MNKIDDNNTLVKLTSNLYGVEFALRASPVWGIPKLQLLEAVTSMYREGDLPTGVSIDSLLTNHNQFGYVLRFYGAVGLALLLWLCVTFFRLIAGMRDEWSRALLYGTLIFLIQFSLLHNTFLIGVPVFWLLIAGVEEEPELWRRLKAPDLVTSPSQDALLLTAGGPSASE